MKALGLNQCLQQTINNAVMEQAEYDENGFGFDAMLGAEVIAFLKTHHNLAKPLIECVAFKSDALFMLDEHELAMI